MKNKKHLTIVGGVGISEDVLKEVLKDSLLYFKGYQGSYFTFRSATNFKSRESLDQACQTANLIITYSGGLLPVVTCLNKSKKDQLIVAIAPPIKRPRSMLTIKTAVIVFKETVRLIFYKDSEGNNRRRWLLIKSLLGLVLVKKLYDNIGQNRLKMVANFDSLKAGCWIRDKFSTPVYLIYPDKDELFGLNKGHKDRIRNTAIDVRLVDGRHCDFLINSFDFLEKADAISFLKENNQRQ